MPPLQFQSSDGKYGFVIGQENLSKILEACILSGHNETGGILVGYYTKKHDIAVLTAVSTAPADSRHGRNWFERGVHGLQYWLRSLWNSKRYYYLGEWHFHPNQSPTPSGEDMQQMRSIAESARYRCPEPLLLVIGGNPRGNWTAQVSLFPRAKDVVELIQLGLQFVSRSVI